MPLRSFFELLPIFRYPASACLLYFLMLGLVTVFGHVHPMTPHSKERAISSFDKHASSLISSGDEVAVSRDTSKKHVDFDSIIMLSPVGDALEEGRRVPDGKERASARKMATLIKEYCALHAPNIHVVLTHRAGEQITQTEKAAYANRLKLDCYIAIGCYTSTKLTVDILLYKQERTTINDQPLYYPLSAAYLMAPQATSYAAQLKSSLMSDEECKHYQVSSIQSAPIADLLGLSVPAVMLDIGLVNNESAAFIAPVIARALINTLMR